MPSDNSVVSRAVGGLIVDNDKWSEYTLKTSATTVLDYGTLLCDDGSGKLVAFNSAKTTTTAPIAIVGNENGIDISSGDKVARVVVSGCVRVDKFVFVNSTDTIDTMFNGMSIKSHLFMRFGLYMPEGYDNLVTS